MKPPSTSPGQVLPDDLLAQLAEALAPVALPADRAEAIKTSVQERIRACRTRLLTVRADEGKWVDIAPGVQSKLLHDDGRMRSFLLRLAPGARLPAHGHSAEEACLVLEGSAQLGDFEVRAGDFHLAERGSVHGEITSRSGALLFIRAASDAGPRVKTSNRVTRA